MKISICIATLNRRNLLLRTLNSIEYNNKGKKRDLEIIIVEDSSRSEERIDDVVNNYSFPVLYLPVTEEFKQGAWSCPVIPFNLAFNFATGDIVIIQNAENLHVGDIVGYVLENMRKSTYLSFGCYSMNEKDTVNLHKKIKRNYSGENIKKAVGEFKGFVKPWTDGDTCWYNHSIYRPGFNYFCCAMPRKDLEELNGFDERYAHGFAYDDCELLIRIARKPMIQKHVDDPFVIHQFHGVTNYLKHRVKTEINRQLYMHLTCAGTFVKAQANKVYAPKNNFRK
jgi:glycosyltransferase involved in cell wall biosynthesis